MTRCTLPLAAEFETNSFEQSALTQSSQLSSIISSDNCTPKSKAEPERSTGLGHRKTSKVEGLSTVSGPTNHVHFGTPCETYSALRENPPGPRPLRSATELEGIKKGLTAQEKKQLREGNEHTSFSGDAMVTCIGSGTSFALENPEPLNEVSIFNMPKIKEVARQHEVKNVDLDQCVFGAETRKPTSKRMGG